MKKSATNKKSAATEAEQREAGERIWRGEADLSALIERRERAVREGRLLQDMATERER